jgi:hypothetical protein
VRRHVVRQRAKVFDQVEIHPLRSAQYEAALTQSDDELSLPIDRGASLAGEVQIGDRNFATAPSLHRYCHQSGERFPTMLVVSCRCEKPPRVLSGFTPDGPDGEAGPISG